MIHFSHVYKTYPGPVHALRDVELKVEKGEFIFLTGPSGAGKSTLFKLLSGYDRPSSGQIEVAGYNLNHINSSELPYFRRKIGVVFQDFKLLRNQSIFENICLPLQIRNVQPVVIERKGMELLEKVGLLHKRDFLPEQLSGGEQQRVAIARALVHQPGILVADEPTGNLDPQLTEEIMDLLEFANEMGTTVFVATHDQALVERRKKRQLVIKGGQIKDVGVAP